MYPELLHSFKPFVSLEFSSWYRQQGNWFFFSFNDVKHGLHVNHQLFANDRDVESDGVHPFQHLRILNARYLLDGERIIWFIGFGMLYFVVLKILPTQIKHSHLTVQHGVCAGRSRMVKVPAVGWSCSRFGLFTLAAHDILPPFLTEDSIFFSREGWAGLWKEKASSRCVPECCVPASRCAQLAAGQCVRHPAHTRAFAFQISWVNTM